ncbi:MerR family transcriptional regulator [Desulfohalobiaceae bacterium Ax17]|jgi:DNA-binding transcriptional MerR regulator|uniref:MerR family transcriptional regulator n=1 Tax=Desulfovulcanus ferrireducens TaxID=2831190 RepID=UPI00207BB23E|nr:MerR family transcriptional regulator [Desulfovulcanus ferrireducens]MBT8763078.1 MerR family transcriptional regulator [Desulfovulcanus ferrireducens]
MSDELLTIKEIAHRLNVPESNIRYYRDKFERFLPYIGQGRKRRYKPEALEVFALIVNEFAQNKNSEEVEKILSRKFPQNPQLSNEQKEEFSPSVLVDEPKDFFMELARSQSKTLEKMAEAISMEQKLRADIAVLDRGYRKMKKALWLIWREQKRQNANPDRQFNDILKRVEELEAGLQTVLVQQQKLEEQLVQELKILKEKMNKCQFWTKRIMLQFTPEKLKEMEEDDN